MTTTITPTWTCQCGTTLAADHTMLATRAADHTANCTEATR